MINEECPHCGDEIEKKNMDTCVECECKVCQDCINKDGECPECSKIEIIPEEDVCQKCLDTGYLINSTEYCTCHLGYSRMNLNG